MNIMQLISYVKTARNKWLLISESRGDPNRCTLCRGNLIHMTCMLPASVHIRQSYAFCGRSPYMVTFHADSTELDKFTAPKKMWSQLHLSARLSSPRDPPQFLSQHNHWSNALKLNIYWWIGYIGLLSSYHQHVISTFNTYSWEPTYRSLIDTGEGYNLGGAGLSHHTLWPF
jgi:hypothetical protein